MEKEIGAIIDTVIELIVNIDRRIDDITGSSKTESQIDQERLRNILEDMQALAEGIDVVSGRFTGIDLLEFKEKLYMLAEALESSDTALFTDILKFEIKDLLEYWKDCLTK